MVSLKFLCGSLPWMRGYMTIGPTWNSVHSYAPDVMLTCARADDVTDRLEDVLEFVRNKDADATEAMTLGPEDQTVGTAEPAGVTLRGKGANPSCALGRPPTQGPH